MGPNDVDGVGAAHTTDPVARTGCTVLVFPDGAAAGVHTPGSATGTRELSALSPGHLARRIHGLVLSGGSAFGLAAADGAMRALAEADVGHRIGTYVVPIVPAAILFDLSVATRRPTAADGYDAAQRALGSPERMEQGSVGAGTGAKVGVASGRAASGGAGCGGSDVGPWRVAVIVACNALGSVLDEDGGWLAGGPPSGEAGEAGAQTTLAAVVTDAALDREQCVVVAKMASAGLARVLVPAFMPFDGDVVFCAATGKRAGVVAPEELAQLGHAAARAVEHAVRAGVRSATKRS